MLHFPIGWNEMHPECQTKLAGFSETLMEDFQANRITRYDERINGDLFEYKVNQSKPIINKIDTALAKHYGLTPEELDFIINYDIKYRLGRDTEDSKE